MNQCVTRHRLVQIPVGFGDRYDEGTLRQIATTTHSGRFYSVGDLQQLTAALAASYRPNLGAHVHHKRTEYLDQVEATVWAIFQNHKSVGLEEGFDALLLIVPGVSNARHGQALRIRLLIEEKLAWFALQLDRTDVALRHARRSMKLALRAFRESAGEKGHLLRFGESALVASISLQKMHKAEDAFAFIKAADEANKAVGQLPGSEHLRQRGASFMHMGPLYDDRADKVLARASLRDE